jgi:hypothetical protein
MSLPAVASKAHRLQLPRRPSSSLRADYDPSRRQAYAHLFAGWRRSECRIRRRPFWTKAPGVIYSDEARKQKALRHLTERFG